MKALLISAAVACFALTSCTSTYRVEGARGALAKRGTVRIVVNSEDSGDKKCRSAVETELRNRGFRVSDNPNADLTVRMIDNWRWDIVMYLLELDLVFKDARTGLLKAQAHYSNSPFHGYPSQVNVVRQLFMEMDAKGLF